MGVVRLQTYDGPAAIKTDDVIAVLDLSDAPGRSWKFPGPLTEILLGDGERYINVAMAFEEVLLVLGPPWSEEGA